MQKSVDQAIEALQKKLSKRVVYNLAKGPEVDRPEGIIPTGIISLDYLLSGGLLPGRIVELIGMEGVGKTTIAYHLAAAVQRANPDDSVVFVNAEYALDSDYYAKCGGDIERTIVVDPDDGDQALEATRQFVEAGVPLVIVDSVAGLVPRSELAGEVGDQHIGLLARLMNQTMRILGPGCRRTGSIVIFINQIRMAVGQWGNPETTPGGMGLRFHASARLDMRRVRGIKVADADVGIEARVKVLKLKWGIPQRKAVVQIYFGEGISALADLLMWGEEKGFIARAGSYYYYVPTEGDKVSIGQGQKQAMESLRTETQLADELSGRIRKELFGDSSTP